MDSVEHLLREPVHGVGVVGRSQQRLGQHAHRTDRGLELMADVCHEVAARRFHPRVLGLVVDVDDSEAAIGLGQQPHVSAHRQPRPPWIPAFPRRQVDLAVLTGGQCALGREPGPVVEQPVPDQAQLTSAVVGVDDVTVGVDHDYPHRRLRNDVIEHLGDGEAGLLGRLALSSLENAWGESGPQPDTDHQCKQCHDCREQQRRYHTHAKIVRIR